MFGVCRVRHRLETSFICFEHGQCRSRRHGAGKGGLRIARFSLQRPPHRTHAHSLTHTTLHRRTHAARRRRLSQPRHQRHKTRLHHAIMSQFHRPPARPPARLTGLVASASTSERATSDGELAGPLSCRRRRRRRPPPSHLRTHSPPKVPAATSLSVLHASHHDGHDSAQEPASRNTRRRLFLFSCPFQLFFPGAGRAFGR